MNWNPFNWLRSKAAESFAAGIADAIRAVTPEGETPPPDLDGLRALVASAATPPKALPPKADDDQPATKRRK